MYIAASINLVGQREKLTGQMPKLAGKCPVTDCYYEHWEGVGGDIVTQDISGQFCPVISPLSPPTSSYVCTYVGNAFESMSSGTFPVGYYERCT